MKRSGGPQQSAEAARQAADKLRDATNLLGGTQQQLASGKVNSLSHEADRLTQEEVQTAATQTLELVYGLVKNIRVVMDGEHGLLASSSCCINHRISI